MDLVAIVKICIVQMQHKHNWMMGSRVALMAVSVSQLSVTHGYRVNHISQCLYLVTRALQGNVVGLAHAHQLVDLAVWGAGGTELDEASGILGFGEKYSGWG